MKNNIRNRIHNASHPFQGDHKKVLCVCSAGLLRSPTAAVVLSQEPFNYNTRAAGLVPEFALVSVDQVLLHWADEIVCMEPRQLELLRELLIQLDLNTPVICLDIEDSHPYRSPELMAAIRDKYTVMANAIQK